MIRHKAKSAIIAEDYPLALTKLRAYKICDPSKAFEADSLIAGVFNKITAQRNRAFDDRNEAEKQTKIARIEKARAEVAQRNAERQAYLAQLSALSSNASLLNNENPTMAFRLACLAYEGNPSPENAAILNRISSDTTNRMSFFKSGNHFAGFAYNDEKSILYGSNHESLNEYNEKGDLIKRFPFTAGPLQRSAVSPDALYTAAVTSKNISLYRHADYMERRKALPGTNIFKVRWSSNGANILLYGDNGIHVFDTLLNEVYKLTGKYISTFDVSPQMDAIAIADGYRVILYDPENQLPIDTINEQTVDHLAFSSDGSKLYTSSNWDKKIKQWVSDSEDPLLVFGEHAGKILSMSFRPGPDKKDTILSTSEDGISILWTEDGKIIKTLRNKADRTNSTVFSTEGKIAVAMTGKGLHLWDLHKNPLGIIAKQYPDKNVVDVAKGITILRNNFSGNAFTVITADSARELSLPVVAYEMSVIDGKDRFLLRGVNYLVIFNIATGEKKVLLDSLVIDGNAFVNTDVTAEGNILCWKDKTLFYFNKEGNLLKKREYPVYLGNICMVPGTNDLLRIEEREVSVTDIFTGEQKEKGQSYDLNREYLRGIQCAPSGEYFLGWSQNRVYLFDRSSQLLRTYERDFIEKVKFSGTGDSIYILGKGAEVRYTLEGLKRSGGIYKLTIGDKIRYNVPNILKDIMNKRNWTEYEACISYFTIDYYSSRNEASIEQLNYLASQSERFFQRNREYYSMLDTRINVINSYLATAKSYRYAALEKVLLKISANLIKEKKTLAAIYK